MMQGTCFSDVVVVIQAVGRPHHGALLVAGLPFVSLGIRQPGAHARGGGGHARVRHTSRER